VTLYFIRRLVYFIPTLFGIALLSFVMLKLAGGDPALRMAGEEKDPVVIENIRRELGLHRPAPIQFLSFVGGVVRGDLGSSFITRRPVADEIARRYPRTLILAVIGISIAFLAGVALGVVASLRPYSWIDNASMLVALLGISVPSFWLGLMLIYLFSVQLRWLPSVGLDGPLHLVLPAVVISSYSLALTARMSRAGMLEILRNDYMRTARAKGLGERAVVLRHALKNALMPVVTLSGVSFGYMLGSAVVVETIFSIDGIGSMIVAGILARDTPIVQAGLMVVAANFVVILLLLDLLHAFLDPRIRF
jgi:ABC-type dipeptide/oligopeptide/nickel transport system permease component